MPGKILISPTELADMMAAGGVVLIDTRSPKTTPSGISPGR